MISGFLAAVSFLTRVPVGRRFVFGPEEVARSERWFPLVGALLGGISVACVFVLRRAFPPVITAILLTVIAAFLTGCMHLDGLADAADGFGGGATPSDVLRIMRDHAIGSYGGVTLVLTITLKIAALAVLIDAGRAMLAVFLAPVIGRWSAVLLSATQPYARPSDDHGGTAGAPSRFVGRTELAMATVTALAFSLAIDPWHGVPAFGLAALASIVWAVWCRRRIGGITGDTLGAAIELSELLVLLLFVGLR